MDRHVLEIDDLTVTFGGHGGPRPVVNRVDLAIDEGEIVSVIGESGSGKTVMALAVLGLLPGQAKVAGGTIRLGEKSLLHLAPGERRNILGKDIAFIPQDAMRALNPTITVADQVGEPFVIHRSTAWDYARRRANDLLRAVHLADAEQRGRDYPHEFSGGMQQRAMIAMGLALEPSLLIADEPTTALDVTVQAQVLRLLREIRDTHGTSILFISHDLSLVAGFCDRVYVMYAGRIVEEGPAERIFSHPRHPYTTALLAATPSASARVERLNAIPGQIPQADELPAGCVFRPRCPLAVPQCEIEPPFLDAGFRQRARCWFAASN
jgi:oligopeptide/dipeptide ABC transporter ATP-binding protein